MKDKKPKRQVMPTAEEFLQFIPRRYDYEWYTDNEGLVHIKVPKFESNVGKKFCALLRKDQIMIADMDELGSIVWKNCDGKNSVADILEILRKKYPDQKEIDQRLFLFIQQMGQLRYILY